VRSSNPVLTRLGEARGQGRGPSPSGYGQPGYGQPGYSQPGYGQPAPYGHGQPGFPPGAPPAVGRTMDLDDVVVRTIALLAVTGLAGAIAWWLVPDTSVALLAIVGGSLAGFVLALVIAFGRITNPLIIAGYAVLQGAVLGTVSRYYEAAYGGIVIQAVVATFAVFFGMAMLYKFRVLRATPRFTKFVLGALIGFVGLALVNLVLYLVGFNTGLTPGPTGEVSIWAWLFAIAGVVIGALTFILDFAEVEQGVRMGLPEKFSWYCAFGLLVGLIFLYWQILRLLSYIRR